MKTISFDPIDTNIDSLSCAVRDSQGDLGELVARQLFPELEISGLSLGNFLVGLGQYLAKDFRFSAYNLSFQFNREQHISEYLIELGFGFDDAMERECFQYPEVLEIPELRHAIRSGFLERVEECDRVLNLHFSDQAIAEITCNCLQKKKEVLENACVHANIAKIHFLVGDKPLSVFEQIMVTDKTNYEPSKST